MPCTSFLFWGHFTLGGPSSNTIPVLGGQHSLAVLYQWQGRLFTLGRDYSLQKKLDFLVQWL